MTKVIAEIGWNHMGNIDLAEHMIQAAAYAGADFVKFQTFSVNRLAPGPWDKDGRRDLYKKAELNEEEHIHLKSICDWLGVKFMSTAFCIEDAKTILKATDEYVKIPSQESRNRKLLSFCNDYFDNIIMSTGTSNLKEIYNSTTCVRRAKLTLLHCVSTYPCPPEKANLPRILYLKEFCDRVGYSDHVEGVNAAKVSLEYGVDYIEKHFTTDKKLPGRDNKFAILPEELKSLVFYIKERKLMRQSRGSDFQECEKESREIYTGRWSHET